MKEDRRENYGYTSTKDIFRGIWNIEYDGEILYKKNSNQIIPDDRKRKR